MQSALSKLSAGLRTGDPVQGALSQVMSRRDCRRGGVDKRAYACVAVPGTTSPDVNTVECFPLSLRLTKPEHGKDDE